SDVCSSDLQPAQVADDRGQCRGHDGLIERRQEHAEHERDDDQTEASLPHGPIIRWVPHRLPPVTGSYPQPGPAILAIHRTRFAVLCPTQPTATLSAMVIRADIGVIGGFGFYSLLDEAEEVEVTTPYGPPSDVVTVGRIGSRTVAFIPRHGRDHRFPPHRIPYRANLWALRSLDVRQVLAPSAVGSLKPELGPGAIVIPDQLVDRTSGRAQTYYDDGAVHVSFADPYCPSGRETAVAAARAGEWQTTHGGTLVLIEGPRFPTLAATQ